MVTAQCANTGDDHAENPADNHSFAEDTMPAARRRQQRHRAADDERRESDGTREPLEISAEASSASVQTRNRLGRKARDRAERNKLVAKFGGFLAREGDLQPWVETT